MRGEDRTIHPPDAATSLAAANGSAVRSWPTGGPGILAEYNAPCLTSQSNGSNGLPYMVGTEVWTLFDCALTPSPFPHRTANGSRFCSRVECVSD